MNASGPWGVLVSVDDILRRRARTTAPSDVWPLARRLAGAMLAAGAAYGAVMGSYGGLSGQRVWQVVNSGAKVPLLLGATTVIALPAFFVANTLAGLRGDFGQALRSILAAQAALAIVLASLAPLTVVWYLSADDYYAAVLFNGALFAAASLAGQGVLRGYYEPLIARQATHRLLLWLWIVLYVFVGIQMAWVLRPFVGKPGLPVTFFRQGAWDNAYVVVLRLIWEVLRPWLEVVR